MLHEVLFLALVRFREGYLILVSKLELRILGPRAVNCTLGVSGTNFDRWLIAGEWIYRKIKFVPIPRSDKTFGHLSHLHNTAWLQSTLFLELSSAALQNMIVVNAAGPVAVARNLHHRSELQALAFQLLD